MSVWLCGCAGADGVEPRADHIVDQMSTREKVGQKIMMAFRYWCPDDQPTCTAGMTELPPAAGQALRDNAIGGVILFSENLTGLSQTRQLTGQLRAARSPDSPVGLLIGADQEGGNVFRLPRTLATTFPGNMALGAAWEGTGDRSLAVETGRVLGAEMRAAGLNVNFAPAVDVNSNPRNPVINVRAYGDDPATVGLLGRLTVQGMREQQVIGTFKHFPGHGDTATDSHYGLPVVEKTRADADAIDLAPYRQAIESGQAPDMIMTAHIQYPSLDSTPLPTRDGRWMVAPATMSRKIQHDILRRDMGYRGVTITDALDMRGISDFFDPADAVIEVFRADVDIALMPVEIRTAAQAGELRQLIDRVVAAIDSGRIDGAELDRSVSRIVQMKLRNGITPADEAVRAPELSVIGGAPHRAVEERVARQSVTLLRNENAVLPLRSTSQRIFILTPWQEQAEAMRRRFEEHGYRMVTGARPDALPWPLQQQAIDTSDVVIVGTLAAGATPSDASQMRAAMEYAKQQGKTVIHATLRAPYDVVDYDDVADATLATYAYYGYEDGLRGPSMPALVDVMLGASAPRGKLPVTIHARNADGTLGPVRYARGFGLQY